MNYVQMLIIELKNYKENHSCCIIYVFMGIINIFLVDRKSFYALSIEYLNEYPHQLPNLITNEKLRIKI